MGEMLAALQKAQGAATEAQRLQALAEDEAEAATAELKWIRKMSTRQQEKLFRHEQYINGPEQQARPLRQRGDPRAQRTEADRHASAAAGAGAADPPLILDTEDLGDGLDSSIAYIKVDGRGAPAPSPAPPAVQQ